MKARSIESSNPDDLLISAAKKGNINNIKNAIKQGANVHAGSDYALKWASYNGHLEIVKFLINNGANPSANDNEPLRWADLKGHQEVARILSQNIVNEEEIFIPKDLSQMESNELLVGAINLDNGKGDYNLIQEALDKGADQLWWDKGGSRGGIVGMRFPIIINSIVRITNIKQTKNTSYSGNYEKTNFRIIYEHLYGRMNGQISSSQIFWRRFEPINQKFKDDIELGFKNIRKIKNIVRKYES